MKYQIPVITANFSPLRFVLKDTADAWAPTLENINNRDYDYVKLHRSSTSLDIGIAPYSMGVCFDGTLVLPALPEFRDTAHALTQFNRTLSELLLGGIYCEAVTPDDVSFGTMSETLYVRMHGCPEGLRASFHHAARTTLIGAMDVIRLLDPETVTVDELQGALKAGRKLIGELGGIPREQVLYGTTFYVRRQWAEALIHLWTTTERIVEIAWQKYIVDALQPLPKKRRAFLNDHKTWPVSAKLEMLFQKALLPKSTYVVLDEARKARNDFAHRGLLPTQDIASKALTGCFELASLCASGFSQADLFKKVVSLIIKRCRPDCFPGKRREAPLEVQLWLDHPIPPIPGDKKWGDREYEIVESMRLKLLTDPK